MTLPFGWTALDHTRPVNTGHVRNPQAVKAEQWIAEYYVEASLSSLEWSETETRQLIQIAMGVKNGEQCKFE